MKKSASPVVRPPNMPIAAVTAAQDSTQTASSGTRLFSLSDTVPNTGEVIAITAADNESVNANSASLPPMSSITHSGKNNVRILAEKIVSEKS